MNKNTLRRGAWDRRSFLQHTVAISGGAILLSSPLLATSQPTKTTVGDIINLFLKEVNGAPFANTVDTLKSGSATTEVKGIVTTMFATIPVIEQAIKLGANFIIAHEPTFYSHTDETGWLETDSVFKHKKELLDKHKIAVWRNHDYIHSHRPDGVYSGLLDALGWKQYTTEDAPHNINLPATTLKELIKTMKEKLNISNVRYIGNDDQSCRKVLLMPGAAGGRRQISAIAATNPDVAVVGELQEWETAEYVRDARAAGKQLSLVVLGHTDSEDGGSVYMRDWLRKKVPELEVTHIHSGNPFSFA